MSVIKHTGHTVEALDARDTLRQWFADRSPAVLVTGRAGTRWRVTVLATDGAGEIRNVSALVAVGVGLPLADDGTIRLDAHGVRLSVVIADRLTRQLWPNGRPGGPLAAVSL